MKFLSTVALLFAAQVCLFAAGEVSGQNPAADPRAVVTSGNARFTVLTDRLVRMEWSGDAAFEDRASLTFVNRRLPVPKFKAVNKKGTLTIKTKSLTLTYKGDKEFNAENLKVQFRLNGKAALWHPGDLPSGNLKGTTRTLDRCEGFSQISRDGKELEDGILSRDGWAVVDDSENLLLQKDSSSWGVWVASRPETKSRDLYFFAYGHDYNAAIRDYTSVAGKVPLPPRYTFGYWWSRYWVYTDREILDLASEMRSRSIPLDVFVIDMDWHETWKELRQRIQKDEFGQGVGWTGYTWNRKLFPDPEGFLRDLHALGCKTSLNLHPASGIQPYEECYGSFVKDYLSRTENYDGPAGYVYPDGGYRFAANEKAVGEAGTRAPVPFRIDQQEWADAYFNSVIHPLERQGVDFWWLDWQQWKQSKYIPGLSNTFWLNHCFWEDKQRQGRGKGPQAPRPLIYHRWGGLGSHRYQLGFSGDTYDEWDVLSFLPYFTATASNVCYTYWGHDIGGHMQKPGKGPTDGEMYTRWLQYGVFTPIFKTHSTQSAKLDRRIWSYPEFYPAMKEAIDLRYALSPYIYTAARETYDTGIGMCRPLYYEYPESDEAYNYKEEFFFGDRILATALCKPMKDGLTERTMWFPAGCDWYDMARHNMEKGGSVRTLFYAIDENPWYVKAGSVIPLAKEGISNLQEEMEEFRLLIVPGNGSDSYCLYEDDGQSKAYETEHARTSIEKKSSDSGCNIIIGARKGMYEGAMPERRVTLVLEGRTTAPSSVLIDGKPYEADFLVSDHSVSFSIPPFPARNRVAIDIRY